MIIRDDFILLPRHTPAKTCGADDIQGDLASNERRAEHNERLTYREYQIHCMTDFHLLLDPPYIVKEVLHDKQRLVPNELIVPLWQAQQQSTYPVRRRTSEKAGAAIFLNLFHSSPSDATMLSPKNRSRAYCSMGLGNRARYVVISCGGVSADAEKRAKRD